jgi:trigger factor
LELVNRHVDFDVEILEVKEKILPEVNEEFAKAYGAGSVDELFTGIRRDLQSELDFRQRRSVRDQLLGGLLKQVDFELPESVVSSETRNLVYNIVNENQKRGIAREVIEGSKDDIYKAANSSAKDRVKASFIIGQIAEKKGSRRSGIRSWNEWQVWLKKTKCRSKKWPNSLKNETASVKSPTKL